MSRDLDVQLGLCCLNTELRAKKTPVFASRSIILKTFKDKGFEHLKPKILDNLKDILTMIDWNESNGIRVFRLSSEIFPHMSNPLAPDYDFDFAKPLLKQIGDKAKQLGHRITFHPGQYNVVGTPNPDMFKKTCLDLKYHADMLDLMDMGKDSVIVIHGGGVYGNKSATITRWCEQFLKLPECVKSRLVIENCEKNFSVIDCLEVSRRINIPVVFDTHHFECYKILHPDEEFLEPEMYIQAILETWERRDIKPKFHVSEQGSGKCGHHSDFIKVLPTYLLEIPEIYGIPIDIMIEAKMKEQAIFKLYEKYPYIDCKIRNSFKPNIEDNKQYKEKEKEKLDNSLSKQKLKLLTKHWATMDCDCC